MVFEITALHHHHLTAKSLEMENTRAHRPQLITTINISHKLTIIIEIEKSQISNQEIGLMMVSIQGNLMHGYYEIYH
jgi:hypothetical protein